MELQELLTIENEKLRKELAILKFDNFQQKEFIKEQEELVANMRKVLKFCSLDNQGSYYQQQSAKAMLSGQLLKCGNAWWWDSTEKEMEKL